MTHVGGRLIELSTFCDKRGSLTVVESAGLPFAVDRVFHVYDVPEGVQRAGHAQISCHELLVAVAGSFDVELDDGRRRTRYRLDRPDRGLHVPPMVWRTLSTFSPGTVCLALASGRYDPDDYIWEYQAFLENVAGGRD